MSGKRSNNGAVDGVRMDGRKERIETIDGFVYIHDLVDGGQIRSVSVGHGRNGELDQTLKFRAFERGTS
jgi:hypothetical protein